MQRQFRIQPRRRNAFDFKPSRLQQGIESGKKSDAAGSKAANADRHAEFISVLHNPWSASALLRRHAGWQSISKKFCRRSGTAPAASPRVRANSTDVAKSERGSCLNALTRQIRSWPCRLFDQSQFCCNSARKCPIGWNSSGIERSRNLLSRRTEARSKACRDQVYVSLQRWSQFKCLWLP